jgi:hypothetical protein
MLQIQHFENVEEMSVFVCNTWKNAYVIIHALIFALFTVYVYACSLLFQAQNKFIFLMLTLYAFLKTKLYMESGRGL